MSFPQVSTLSSMLVVTPDILINSRRGIMRQAKEKGRTRVFRSCERSLVNVLFGLFSLALWISPASGTVTVVSQITNSSVAAFEDQPARFIPERVTVYGIQGLVIYANPPSACEPVDKPPQDFFPTVNWILVARRFECDFQRKIENAQNAGYSAIIVHNVGSNATEAMGADNPSKLYIYACFVGEFHGHLLRDNFTYEKGFYVRIQDDFSMNAYLLPFAIVVGVCFLIMLAFMLWQQVVRWLRERRRARRRKLPSSALKKLPINKWTKGDPYETCAVCLEDFIEQDKVRVLPCSHGFHNVCIDPWLTKGRRVCPICKRKVILADENFPFSETDTDDESAPLLGPSSAAPPNSASSSNSTFVQPENPYRRAQRRALQGYSDTASTSGSVTSSESDTISSHLSLPVMAQVHSHSNLYRPTTAFGPHTDDSISTHTATRSQSQFYVSCQEGEDDDDEEMLDLAGGPPPAPASRIESHPQQPQGTTMLTSSGSPIVETAVEVTVTDGNLRTPGPSFARNAIV